MDDCEGVLQVRNADVWMAENGGSWTCDSITAPPSSLTKYTDVISARKSEEIQLQGWHAHSLLEEPFRRFEGMDSNNRGTRSQDVTRQRIKQSVKRSIEAKDEPFGG
uniref:Uncharacterized protein n=1 Tax=Ditylenchus dipsaci TaxID=166011 RepID=A0A915DM22_9BILA